MKDKKTIVVIVGVIGLLVAVLGITYAYFTANITGNENATSVIVGTARLGLTFDSGDTITGDKIIPGWSNTKTFTVKNTSTVKLYYSINWTNITNTFTNKADLVYSLNGSKEKGTSILPDSNSLILDNVEIDPGETHSYTLTVTYKNTSSDQSADQGKVFMGKIEIKESLQDICEISENVNLLQCQILSSNGGKDVILAKNNPNFNKVAVSQSYYDTLTEETTPKKIQAIVENGIYGMEDDYGISYYFRGAKDLINNNVIFAGYQWKIIRITGNGSVKLIYNGTEAQYNSNGFVNATGTDTQIGTSAFNTVYNNNGYVGYMYGTPGSNNYENEHANINDSKAKIEIDNWYRNNILNQGNDITDKIVDTIFCNDRSIMKQEGSNTELGYGMNETWYSPMYRILTKKNEANLNCKNENDQFTITTSNRGNKNLTYPVGLITIDELSIAGGVYGVASNNFYLYTQQIYWTMSPFRFANNLASIWDIRNTANLNYSTAYYGGNGLRPVLALSSTAKVTGGNGSSTNPYIVS